jgi:hypothetical protein
MKALTMKAALPRTLAALAAVVAVAAPLAVQAAPAQHHPPRDFTLCKSYERRTITGPWGSYILRNDVFAIPGLFRPSFCITHRRGQPSFTVRSAWFDSRYVAAYPEVFDGCEYGACSPGSILPMQVSKLPSSLRFSAYDKLTKRWRGGKFNTSLDIWFSRHRSTRGRAAGAELMVWLYHRDVRTRPSWRVRIGRVWWRVEEWTTHSPDGARSWPLIIFIRERPSAYCHRLHLRPFIRFAELHGWMNRTLWLESIAHGYEIWGSGMGGDRLTTTFFRVLR